MRKIVGFLALVALSVAPLLGQAEDGIVRYADTFSSQAEKDRFTQTLRDRIDWIHTMTETKLKEKRGYQKPDAPEVFLVSRAHMVLHAAELCPAESEELSLKCVGNKFGWTDWKDGKHAIYLLRKEDIALSPAIIDIPNFPIALWLEAVKTHELVHRVQLAGSLVGLHELPCARFVAMEEEADFLMRQWLHSLRNVDAERINTMFRGETYACPR